jgi:drug/metabolite transporter (DMT)-like permease
VLLSVLTGSPLSLTHALGVGVALLGVVGVSITFPQALDPSPVALDGQRRVRWSRGVGLAVSAALGYGIAFWLLGARVSPQLGPLFPIWLIRLVTPCLLVAGAKPFRQSLRLPQGSVWWFVGGVGLFDTIGYVCSAAGLATGPLAIVGVLISLFSAVTVLLAWVFLRERLQWSQWLGVGLIFVGMVLVNS